MGKTAKQTRRTDDNSKVQGVIKYPDITPHNHKAPPPTVHSVSRRGFIMHMQSAAGGETCEAGFCFLSHALSDGTAGCR